VDASDVGQEPGQFVWQSDGTKVDAALWARGNPDHFGAGEDAGVYLKTEHGKLFDYRCSSAHFSFICEVAEKDFACL